jgi:peptidoglycan glycosyltransferase
LVLFFLSGVGFLAFELYMNAANWALKPFNSHLSLNSLANAGKIFDRNSVILAESANSKRIYNKDDQIRKALFHTVGDENFNVATSIQSKFRDQLFGYNFFMGVDSPEFLREHHDITLNVDSRLCKTAFAKFSSHKGAIACYNYKTGELLCMVSMPTYDIENPPNFKKNTDGQYDGIFMNKAMSSSYTPGSVFKIVTAMSALEDLPDATTKKFTCNGTEIINGQPITCMGNHGSIGLRDGLRYSCNIVLGNFAVALGKERMEKNTKKLGFGENVIMDSMEVKSSSYELSSKSKDAIAWSGIGQDNVLLNPIHMLTIVGSIANDGVAVMPKLIKEVTGGFLHRKFNDNTQKKSERRYMSSETAQILTEMLSYTIKNSRISSLFSGLDVCAKTGTAEVGAGKKPHAWVAGFSKNKKTPFAFVAVVENSGFGGEHAAPIAAAVLREMCAA